MEYFFIVKVGWCAKVKDGDFPAGKTLETDGTLRSLGALTSSSAAKIVMRVKENFRLMNSHLSLHYLTPTGRIG